MSVILEVSETQLIHLLAQLAPEQRTRIFAQFSTATNTPENGANTVAEPTLEKPHRVPGKGKNHITYMADDFDAPLDEMKEYME